MGAKHSVDDAERLGLSLNQPYARELAENRDKRQTRDAAHAAVADLEHQLATEAAAGVTRSREERKLEEAAFAARAAGGPDYDRARQRLEEFRRTKGSGRTAAEHADAVTYAAWLDREVADSDARLAELEQKAVEYVGAEVARPLHEEAVAEIDEALERMLAAFHKEQRIRSVFRHAFKQPGERRHASMERLSRYIRALGSLEQVGNLGALETAVTAWRKNAREDAPNGRYKVRADLDRTSQTARRVARQWA